MAVKKVLKNGREMWRARVRVDGGRLVTSFHELKRDADKADQRMRAPSRASSSSMTLDELWSRVLAFQTSGAAKKPWRETTVRVHAKEWAHISAALGRKTLDALDQSTIDTFAAALAGARNTVANTLALLRLVLRRGARWGLVRVVPEIVSVQAAPSLGDDEWLTQDELARVLPGLAPEWHRIALVAVRTGLRVGELQALRWRDVEAARVHVRRTWDDRTATFGPPKNGRSRTVPLPSDAGAILGERATADALVFARDDGAPFTRVTYADQLTRAIAGAGLEKRRGTHIMRHTYASHCVLVGVPTRVLMAWAGWSSERMVARYAHLRPADADHYAERLAGYDHGVTTPRLRVVAGG